MCNQTIIDLLKSKFANIEKNFQEIGDQLVHHREAMTNMEKELTSRKQANTSELNATTQLAASNSAKVDDAKADITALKAELQKRIIFPSNLSLGRQKFPTFSGKRGL